MSRMPGDLWLNSLRRLLRQQQKQAVRASLELWLPPGAVRGGNKRPGRGATARKPPVPLAVASALLPMARAAAPAGAATRRQRKTAVFSDPVARLPSAFVPLPLAGRAIGSRPPPVARAPLPPPSRALPVRGQWSRGVFKSADSDPGSQRDLHYWLYWPAGAPASPRPLVVMLHGCGQTATEFAQGTRMNELAQRKGFAVLYPQQSVTSEASRCWHWYSRLNQSGGGDAQLIRDLVRAMLDGHPIDRSRVYVAGISAGAAMAQILALNNPRMIAAVGMHSAPLYGCTDSRATALAVMQNGAALHLERALQPVLDASGRPLAMPAMLIHGDCDKVVRPVNLMQTARQFMLLNGIKGQAAKPLLRDWPARSRGREPRHGYQTLSYLVDGKPRLVVCQIAGLEHAWSGGVGGLRYNSASGPDASLMLWSFFSRQRRAGVWPRRQISSGSLQG